MSWTIRTILLYLLEHSNVTGYKLRKVNRLKAKLSPKTIKKIIDALLLEGLISCKQGKRRANVYSLTDEGYKILSPTNLDKGTTELTLFPRRVSGKPFLFVVPEKLEQKQIKQFASALDSISKRRKGKPLFEKAVIDVVL